MSGRKKLNTAKHRKSGFKIDDDVLCRGKDGVIRFGKVKQVSKQHCQKSRKSEGSGTKTAKSVTSCDEMPPSLVKNYLRVKSQKRNVISAL